MSALAPSRTKYRKSMKGSRAGNAKRGNTLAFGEFGLQSLSRGPMTGQQIEAARVTIARHLKRKGKLWIRIFPHKPVTKKPAEVRMGSGKGAPDHWVAVVKPGRIAEGDVLTLEPPARPVTESGAVKVKRALMRAVAAAIPNGGRS